MLADESVKPKVQKLSMHHHNQLWGIFLFFILAVNVGVMFCNHMLLSDMRFRKATDIAN